MKRRGIDEKNLRIVIAFFLLIRQCRHGSNTNTIVQINLYVNFLANIVSELSLMETGTFHIQQSSI